jgi:hypothetical protein
MIEKIIKLSIIFIFVIFLFISVLVNVNLREDVSELKNKLSLLNKSNTSECTFIQTLRVIDILDYEGAIPEDKFILVDQYQSFNPFVLKANKEDDIKEGKYYEFTFKGLKEKYNNNDDLISDFTILSIKETNKVGLDQIQEVCK